jgi:hypothetical protein
MMAMRNYRQAKRNREESRKKRQQEKLQRKLGQTAEVKPAEETPAAVVEPVVDPKVSP